MDYVDFLEKKMVKTPESGFEPDFEINKHLFPFQGHIVRKALKKGRFAIFADCGLGKTLMQLAWADAVARQTNRWVLILAPLAVSGQTILEGKKFGVYVQDYFEAVTLNDTENCTQGILIANYEQLDNIDCTLFSGIVLDESSILKNYEGKTKNRIIEGFANTPYKLACTATPSPNDPMELGNHAEFLNAMRRNEMLAMYFVHDGGETAKWRLKGHSESSFWQFIASWSVMLSKPSDIGFSDEGYILPDLNLIERQIITPKRENGSLFNSLSISATNFNEELRLTKTERLSEVIDIVNGSDENFIIWIKQNEEGEYLKKLIPDAVEVKGSDDTDYKKKMLIGFANNEFRVLITKTKIAQFGMNYQNCHNQVFASLDFSFEGLYQAIRRSFRFGQKNRVNVWLITTDTMQNVIASIGKKQEQFQQMQKSMTHHINSSFEKQSVTRPEKCYQSDKSKIVLGDCVNLAQSVESESVGFSIFSPPFPELYTYSDQNEDMGNSKNYEEFFIGFQFLVEELYRVMWYGRNVVVHCMDLPIQKGKEGYIGLRDFSGTIRECFEKIGFVYHSRVTIWKDPVVEMQRTKALGLLHKQVKKDSSMSRVGIPDYLLVFRKPGEHRHPIKNTGISVDLWQKYASPIWYDIDYSDTLNGKVAREEKDEKHICPLQLQTIERAIHLWSNLEDTVFSPFAGIGSELYQAVKMGRKAIGFELKESYYDLAVKNIKSAESLISRQFLFK